MEGAKQPPKIWCEQLMRWNKAGGQVMQGPDNRRAQERELCLGA